MNTIKTILSDIKTEAAESQPVPLPEGPHPPQETLIERLHKQLDTRVERRRLATEQAEGLDRLRALVGTWREEAYTSELAANLPGVEPIEFHADAAALRSCADELDVALAQMGERELSKRPSEAAIGLGPIEHPDVFNEDVASADAPATAQCAETAWGRQCELPSGHADEHVNGKLKWNAVVCQPVVPPSPVAAPPDEKLTDQRLGFWLCVVDQAEGDERVMVPQGELRQMATELLALRKGMLDCSTCAGSGLMEVVTAVLPPDEREETAMEECAECGGHGLSAYALQNKELAALRTQHAEAERLLKVAADNFGALVHAFDSNDNRKDDMRRLHNKIQVHLSKNAGE